MGKIRSKKNVKGADPGYVVPGNEAPQISKYLILCGISGLGFWITVIKAQTQPDIVELTLLKFGCYICLLLLLDSVFYLSRAVKGDKVETFEFQRERIKFVLWVVGCLIVLEIPMWLDVLGGR